MSGSIAAPSARRRRVSWPAMVLLAAALVPRAQAEERLSVYVVNYPLQYFAERIGGPHVSVSFPAPPGVDPAFWRPSPEFVAAYQEADLILLNGAAYARWVQTATLPRRRLVDTSRAFAAQLVEGSGVTHNHGGAGEHAHGSFAFTTWLDLSQAAQQARAIMEAFARRRPALRDGFEERFGTLERELMALDAALQAVAKDASGEPLLASHPVYQYLARRYALNLKSLHWEPDRLPDDGEWARLSAQVEQHPAGWMLWEQPPLEASIERLQAMQIGSLVFDPCAGAPAQGDFMTVMRANVERLRRALGRESRAGRAGREPSLTAERANDG